jgi:lipopolysaccharide/colanic/teichoic acid biosynthesis glycosyltransferase
MEITSGQDERITRVGRLLRDYKLDELPQLWNVFRGEMSLVGPRPEMPAFVEQFQAGYAEILQVRPGITDPASLRYRSEAEILGRAADPVTYYTEVILPDKIEISKRYIRNANFRTDMSVILLTMAVLFKK